MIRSAKIKFGGLLLFLTWRRWGIERLLLARKKAISQSRVSKSAAASSRRHAIAEFRPRGLLIEHADMRPMPAINRMSFRQRRGG